jgi:hypothetical protein
MGGADGLLAQALHVERQLLLPLRDQHAGVEHARLQHGAQTLAQQSWLQLRRPGADGLALVVEHPHQVEGQVATAQASLNAGSRKGWSLPGLGERQGRPQAP